VLSGVGLGLRWEFLDELVETLPANLDFLEVSPENYVGRGGHVTAQLARLRERYPLLSHGLTMSLAGTEPFDVEYMQSLRAFLSEMKSPWHSDHLCFSIAGGGRVLHDLLPPKMTKASVARVADRVRRAQDALGVKMAVENISFYLPPGEDEMSEADFVGEVCEQADCGLMLDVNNAYVNAQNFGFDVDAWMKNAPLERTVQIHVAGHEAFDESDFVEGATGKILLDTHGADVPDPVLALLERVLPKTGKVPVVVERDQSIPPFADLMNEVRRVKNIYDRLFG
jgi:uncharacterized protein